MKLITPFKKARVMLLLFCLIGCSLMGNSSFSILDHTLTTQDRYLSEVLDEIGEKFQVFFNYESEFIKNVKVDFELKEEEELEQAVNRLFAQTDLNYELVNSRFILIFKNSNNGKKGINKIRRKILQLEKFKKREGVSIQRISSEGSDLWRSLARGMEEVTAVFPVSGTVTDEAGLPLIGVNILIKGTSTGTTTDLEGKFSLDLSDGQQVLMISYTGFEVQEVAVSGRSVLEITMTESISSLDEVIVVGYGTQKKSDLTGSVASISSEQLNSQPITSLEQGMQGRLAGVHITNNSNAPGGGISVKIRGVTSILNGSEPLYVIDGFPVSGRSQFSTNAGRGIEGTTGSNYTVDQNPLSTINPADIESIEVLKDASAAAIYGVRGANGVILITTKRGSVGAPRISYNQYTGIQSVAKKMDMMNASEWQDFYNTIYTINGDPAPFTGAPPNDTDWQDLIYRQALIQNHQLGVSGGTEAVQYLVSGSFFDQEGVLKGSGFDRYSLRVNLDVKASDKLKFGNSLSVSRTATDAVITEGETKDGITSVALMTSPILPVFQPDGTYSSNRFVNLLDADGVYNPVAFIDEYSDENIMTRIIGSIFGEYSITSNLTFRASLGADFENQKRHVYQTSKFNNQNPLNRATVSSVNRTSWLNENTLRYNQGFGDHNLSILGGFTVQSEEEEFTSIVASGFATDATGPYDLSAGAIVPNIDSRYADFSILSFIGRINYSFKDKYLLTLTARRDGSSKFAAGKQWATFPSIAGAWKISNEEFMSGIAGTVSNLKLRAGYGQVGNQELPPYSSLSLLQSANYNFGSGTNVNGFAPFRVAVPDLTWEITQQVNIGLDISFLNERFNLAFDYYDKRTKDLLLQVTLPETSGITEPSVQNLGEMKNVGWELQADGVIIHKANFRWNIGFNLFHNNNEITSLGDPGKVGDLSFLAVSPSFSSGGPRSYIQVGYPIGGFFGWTYDGLYRNQTEADQGQALQPGVIPGMTRFVDVNGDGVLDGDDRGVIGSPFPDLTFGFNSSISYKAFELRFFFQGQKGGFVYNMMRRVATEPIRGQNVLREMTDYWTESNPDAVWPRRGDLPPVNAMGSLGDSRFFLEDASYLRLREITLTYDLPRDLLGFINGSVYVTGQNLFTITNYKGYNPDVNSRANVTGIYGYDISSYPMARTYLLGFRLNF